MKVKFTCMITCVFFSFRELRSGTTFYIICKSSKESVHLMKFTNRQYIGSFFSIFEPIYRHDVHNNPVVKTESSFIPTFLTLEYMKMNIPGGAGTSDVTSFLCEVPELVISRAVIVKGCPARMCDSGHRDKNCPSLVGSRTDSSALSAVISAPCVNLRTLKLTSEALLSLFVADGQAKKVRVLLLLKLEFQVCICFLIR